MADDDLNQSSELTVSEAASAISALLSAAPAQDAPEEDNTPDSPQSAAPERAEVGNTEETRVEPEPSESAAPAASPVHATPPTSSPELDVRLQEASKAKADAEATRNQLLNQLNTIVPQMQQAIMGEFADIKTIDDLENVAKVDPERYNRFVFTQARLQQATAAQRQVADQANREKNEQARKAWADEQAKLVKLMPDLADPVKGPTIARNLQDYALKIGIKAERLSSYTAEEFVALNRAFQFDNLDKAKAEASKKAASAPPVQKPGVTRPGATKDDKFRTDFERLQKSGHVNDAAAVFRNLLN